MATPTPEQQAQAGPPGGSGGTQGGAIGIPQGFVPPTRHLDPVGLENQGANISPDERVDPFTLQGTVPNNANNPSSFVVNGVYQDGAQLVPQNLPQPDIYALQQQLVQTGLLSPTNVRPGVWDSDSANAYKAVLAYANSTGMKAVDALQSLINNPQIQAAKGAKAPFQLSAPADIEAAVTGGGPGQTNTAQSLIGKNLPSGETDDFLKWYQDQEKSARAQYMAADLSGPGNSYTGAPNIGDAAQVYIKQHNLAETVNYGTGARMLQFFNLLKGVV